MRIAVIADPHVHDTGFDPRGDGSGAVRTLADTIDSTRVFNESLPAFRAALDQVAADGVKLVVIVGDLTDDGQAVSVAAARELLAGYTARHGMRFFTTPGNHDLFARQGRHQSKRFLRSDGNHDLVTSDPDAPFDGSVRRIVTEAMYCAGYDGALPALADLGYMRQPADLHWESPFGADDSLDARQYEITSRDGTVTASMIDASYLVEPVPGLWLLSIDANVYRPSGQKKSTAFGFSDKSDAGWNAAIKHKAFLLDWIANVTRRAALLGKQLLAFSHYPVVDPLDGTHADELALLGNTSFVRRMPRPAVSEALHAAGLRTHFSGHWHVNDTSAFKGLVNIAVSSPVGFPSSYKLVAFDGDRMDVQTQLITAAPGFDVGFPLYRAELARTGGDASLLAATDHLDFLSRHLALMVRHRYLPREWPADLAALVETSTLADLRAIAGLKPGPLGELPFFEMVVDWYRLRKGSGLAIPLIDPARLAVYEALIAGFDRQSWPPESVAARLAIFMRIMGRYLDGAPSADFIVELGSGAINPAQSRSGRGRTDLRQMGTG